MSKNNFEEDDSEVELLPAKKEPKKKSGEERSRDRKVVFWVLFIVLLATFAFWLKAAMSNDVFKIERDDANEYQNGSVKQNDEQNEESDVFFVKYKI